MARNSRENEYEFRTDGFYFDTPSTESRTGKKYWLYEEPEIVETGKNVIRYYREAGKIQFAMPDYIDAYKDTWTGNLIEKKKPGKLSALDLAALADNPEALDWLISIFQDVREEITV